MFTTKINSVYLNIYRSESYIDDLGYFLDDSRERRGAISVSYELTGEYRNEKHGYPIRLTKRNLMLFKRASALFKLIEKNRNQKSIVQDLDYIDLPQYSISEIIEKRKEDPSLKVLVERDTDIVKVGEQDTTNRKKHWFFIKGISSNLKGFTFYIDKSIKEINEIKSENKEIMSNNFELSEIEESADRKYRQEIMDSIIYLYQRMERFPEKDEIIINISDVVPEGEFLNEPIEDKEMGEKLFEHLKTKALWINYTNLVFADAKRTLGMDFDTYGLYSSHRDSVHYDDFWKMILHNPKAYKQVKNYLSNI